MFIVTIMKKMTTIIAFAIALPLLAQKKDECEEMNKRVEWQKLEIAELTKQNQYYKETLELIKPLATTTANNLEFSIVKAVGNAKDKTLTIEYLYKNTSSDIRKYFQARDSYFVDPRGNQSETYEAFANNTKNRVENIQPNIPMKGIIKFKIEKLNFPMIKLLNLRFAYIGKELSKVDEKITFQNIPVTWK